MCNYMIIFPPSVKPSPFCRCLFFSLLFGYYGSLCWGTKLIEMFIEMTAAVKCVKEKKRNAGRAGGEGAFYNSVALIAASETVQKNGWGEAKYMAF